MSTVIQFATLFAEIRFFPELTYRYCLSLSIVIKARALKSFCSSIGLDEEINFFYDS